MLTVGLTGPSGAGKGAVAAILARYGIPSIDTDGVYRQLLIPPSPCLDELAARFGAEILTPEGTLDRKALAALVFAPGHETELSDLNRIAHSHILAETRRRLAKYEAEGLPVALVDAPQLFESGFDAECHFILAVLAPFETRLARILSRDGISREQAVARMNAAHSDEFFRSRAHAVLVNDGDMAALEEDVRKCLALWEVSP